MKRQRILVAAIRNEKTHALYFRIVLAYTDRREFVVSDYNGETGYFNESQFPTFQFAYNDFNARCSRHGQAAYDSVGYCARQFGQAKIIWENL